MDVPSMTESENNTDSRPDLAMPRKAPSPLADPIVCKMFQNETVCRQAMKFIANAVIKNNKYRTFEEIKEIIKVTPQRLYSNYGPDGRSYRVDVEAETSDDDLILMEVQLGTFKSMTDRILLYSASQSGSQARRSEELKDVIKQMKRVLSINILDYAIRPSPHDFHQVSAFFYAEEPLELASDKLQIHHLQLELFRKIEPDFSNPLHVLLTSVDRAHTQKFHLKDVVFMDKNLKHLYDSDSGFAEFVDRFDL
ncbi:MAG: Rpn family recombination-promoting nuclease/putative transposase, partial [Deltaproteobacteria bacterium]|nr:Rpn family recombination-promoting nuclease/putative transposase [Deltaproteobacteria bacterium]